jgi:hypothetical protein
LRPPFLPSVGCLSAQSGHLPRGVLRITHRRLESEPAEVVVAVRSLLDRV